MKFELLGKIRDGDEENATSSAPSGELPIDEVTRLSEQGYAETEIIEQLRDRGYSYGDINEALNAAVKESASQQGGGGMNNTTDQGMGGGQGSFDQGGNDWEPQQGQTFNDQSSQQQQQRAAPEPQPQPEPQYEEDDYYDEGDGSWDSMSITPEEEELIEIIVQEHMADVENEMDQFRAELEKLREDFTNLQQQFNEIDIRKDEDEKVVIQKVNEMEEYFEQTSSRMGGMEKALQQVLPSLVENVRDLSSIVREMKDEKRR